MSLETDLEQIIPVKIKGEVTVTQGPPVKEVVTTFRGIGVYPNVPTLLLGHVPNRKRALIYSANDFNIGSSSTEAMNGDGGQYISTLTSPLELKGTSEVWASPIGGGQLTVFVISEVENG